jgi:hypothetical protein
LLEEGLQEADAFGLQTVLAATDNGELFYEKYGFPEYKTFTTNLVEYKEERKGHFKSVHYESTD